MARVSLEESAFAASRYIANETGMRVRTVLGMLGLFWHDSQLLEMMVASKSQLICWLSFEDETTAEVDHFLIAMQSLKLIKPLDDGRYEITGNDKHINKMREFKEMSSRGGKASGETRSKRTVEAHGSSEQLKPAVEHSSILFSSILDSTNNNTRAPKTPRSPRSQFDLESVYLKYPRKLGKSAGLKKLAKEIQSQDDLDGLNRAMDRFTAHHRAKGTEEKFIPHFSTWVSSWKDWLDPNAGKTVLPIHTLKPKSEFELQLDEQERRIRLERTGGL